MNLAHDIMQVHKVTNMYTCIAKREHKPIHILHKFIMETVTWDAIMEM